MPEPRFHVRQPPLAFVSGGPWVPAALASFALALAPSPAQAEGGPAAGVACEEIAFSVALAPGEPVSYRVAGTLCADGQAGPQTLQLLLHGATYDRTYWHFPFQPVHYSYVRYAHAAGFATLAIDRIGAGASDKPPAELVTTTANAFSVHQIVASLRAGTATTASGRAVRFDRILLVGHSFGTYIAWLEAGTYGDVDGLIASGASHLANPPGEPVALASIYPAQLDPRFASAGLPPGYLTTLPGTRAQAFYFAPGASPAVIALDEATKGLATTGLFPDRSAGFGLTPSLRVPVLGVVGDFDTLACEAPSCSASGSFAREAADYAPEACFTPVVIPQTGHNLNLHQSAPLWSSLAQLWATARVGARADRPPPLPCSP